MWEILTLPTGGNKRKDWGKRTKRYTKYSTALGVMTRLMNTGLYDSIIVRKEGSDYEFGWWM